MKKRKIRLINEQTPASFSETLWFVGYTPKEAQFIAEKNQLPCMCYLISNPITNTVWFHTKTIIHA